MSFPCARPFRSLPGVLASLAAAFLLTPAATHALDKQGSAHGGQLGGASSGFAISGSVLFGSAVYNPSYAARPDNSGKALLRLAPHFDIDLIGSRLSIPIDINLFSDRERKGAGKLAPSELDVIGGLTSTWPLGRTAIELGVRGEGDVPVDRGGYKQAYADARSRWLYSVGAFAPSLHRWLRGGDITGSVTLGWFAYNPSYAARPDNTGRALLRYNGHAQLSVTEHAFIGIDATFFTDKRENPVAPSECDLTGELGANILHGLALHLAYEHDMPIDEGSFHQRFVLLFLSYDFSLVGGQ